VLQVTASQSSWQKRAIWKAAGYAGKKKQGTADRRGQSEPRRKKERWGSDGSKGTLGPKKN